MSKKMFLWAGQGLCLRNLQQQTGWTQLLAEPHGGPRELLSERTGRIHPDQYAESRLPHREDTEAE